MRSRMLTLDDAVLDVASAIGHVHGDRLDVLHVFELDTTCGEHGVVTCWNGEEKKRYCIHR